MSTNKPKTKTIQKTSELLSRNAQAKAKGGGKEKEVFGSGVHSLAQDAKRMPDAINVERFVETRALEILAFQNAIKSAAVFGSSRTFQSLPRHLRRRAASHNPKRVPKRLRSRAAAEIDPGDTIAKKHRKRATLRAKGDLKGRSRTERLLARQKGKTWLGTHIWHAKRFHMVDLWNHRLPLTPTLKSFRPAYRAAKRKVVVHDASYFGIIELEGERNEVVRVMTRVTGNAFAGPRFESGTEYLETPLHVPDQWPLGFIGPAEILWQPNTPLQVGDKVFDSDNRRVWIRIHPSMFQDVWRALQVASQPSVEGDDGATEAGPSRRSLRDELEMPLRIRDLRGEIDAFEIMGPLAGSVLNTILRLCRGSAVEEKLFFEALQQMQNSAELPSRCVAGLRVHDPRLHFPPKPVKPPSQPERVGDSPLRGSSLEATASLARSDLWDERVREQLSQPTFRKTDLDRRRHQLGLPGTKLQPIAQDDRLPIMLLQRSLFSESAGAEGIHGFTLLLPSGWSQYFLSSFAYSGCFIAGLAERRVQYREAGIPSFPEHFGQLCQAGKEWEKTQSEEEARRWARKPPGKRPEYASLGMTSPFNPDWNSVLRPEQTGGVDAVPYLLPAVFSRIVPLLPQQPSPAKMFLFAVNSFRNKRGMASIADVSAERLYRSAVLHVRVEMLGRGSPSDMVHIHALSATERELWLLAHLREEQLGRSDWDDVTQGAQRATQHFGEVKPSDATLIGFTTTGNFSLSRGRGFALATVTLEGYVALLRAASAGADFGKGMALVKVRNRDGVLSRLAKLQMV